LAWVAAPRRVRAQGAGRRAQGHGN
jgi:hypothetical protein